MKYESWDFGFPNPMIILSKSRICDLTNVRIPGRQSRGSLELGLCFRNSLIEDSLIFTLGGYSGTLQMRKQAQRLWVMCSSSIFLLYLFTWKTHVGTGAQLLFSKGLGVTEVLEQAMQTLAPCRLLLCPATHIPTLCPTRLLQNSYSFSLPFLDQASEAPP